jgi:hypothetical protein
MKKGKSGSPPKGKSGTPNAKRASSELGVKERGSGSIELKFEYFIKKEKRRQKCAYSVSV